MAPPSPDKGKVKKAALPTSPERTRLQQLQARSALLQQQSMEQGVKDDDLALLVQQQEQSLESLAPWGGQSRPGSPTNNKSTGRGVVP